MPGSRPTKGIDDSHTLVNLFVADPHGARRKLCPLTFAHVGAHMCVCAHTYTNDIYNTLIISMALGKTP